MHLIVQGPELSRAQPDELAHIVKPAAVVAIGELAFRLKQPAVRKSLDAWCEAHRADHAWVDEGRRFADLKLVAMDMDSTLITIECIDELGDLAGKKAEVAAITAQAMRGEIDYPASLRNRVAKLAGLKEDSLLKVYEHRLKLT